MTSVYGAYGVTPTRPTQFFDLQPGLTRIIPAGTWLLGMDKYSFLQEYDGVTGMWNDVCGNNVSGQPHYVNSDGVNYRVANLCGCIVGANVTTAGSGYTSAPTVSFANSASAAATAIVGGAVNTTVTVTNGGTGYTWAPLVYCDAPPVGAGAPATMTCTISSGAVSTVTVNNQGFGYTNAPNLYFVNDPRDTTGTAATAVATLTGAQTVTGLLITNHGTPATTAQPTITFSSGSAAAFPIMVRSIGAVTLSNVGSGYSGNVLVQGWGTGFTAGASVLTNPRWSASPLACGQVNTRVGTLLVGVDAATKLTSAGASLYDGGIYAGSAPTAVVIGTTQGTVATVSITAVAGFTWSNPNSTISIQPV